LEKNKNIYILQFVSSFMFDSFLLLKRVVVVGDIGIGFSTENWTTYFCLSIAFRGKNYHHCYLSFSVSVHVRM